MTTDDNNQTTADTTATGDTSQGDSSTTDATTAADTITLPRADYDKLNQEHGSFKRELKDLKKAKETTQDTSAPDASAALLEKTFLRAASITAEDEVELALSTAKKWGMSVDQVVDDEDFKEKLEKFRAKKSNEAATSNVRGNGNAKSANQTPEYWIAKGVPPTAADVPDRKTRASIARAMMASSKTGKTFYNE